jgi:hypothetical protein
MFLLVAFAVTLAVVVGNRMSAEAMAVVVGVVCGVAAGIPMSMLLLLVLNRRERQGEGQSYERLGERPNAYPPVVVIQGGTAMPSQPSAPYYPVQGVMAEPTRRQFRVIGEHED